MRMNEIKRDATTTKGRWFARMNDLYTRGYLLTRFHLRELFAIAPAMWWIMAAIWGGLSLVLLSHYAHYSRLVNPTFVWYLCSLFWLLFGFAGVFSVITQGKKRVIMDRVFMALLPPLLLHVVFFSV